MFSDSRTFNLKEKEMLLRSSVLISHSTQVSGSERKAEDCLKLCELTIDVEDVIVVGFSH